MFTVRLVIPKPVAGVKLMPPVPDTVRLVRAVPPPTLFSNRVKPLELMVKDRLPSTVESKVTGPLAVAVNVSSAPSATAPLYVCPAAPFVRTPPPLRFTVWPPTVVRLASGFNVPVPTPPKVIAPAVSSVRAWPVAVRLPTVELNARVEPLVR